MTPTEARTLGERVVKARGWEWSDPMLTMGGERVTRVIDGFPMTASGYQPDAVPDVRDPATLGCLLALVRERWGDHTIHVVAHPGGTWEAMVEGHLRLTLTQQARSSEAEALILALEWAP